VRALAPPYPGARTTVRGRPARILRARVLAETAAATTAPSLGVEGERIVARCGGGGKLAILALEIDGTLVAADALAGAAGASGLPLPV
jgi:methionyl-tRNA formyltransferase